MGVLKNISRKVATIFNKNHNLFVKNSYSKVLDMKTDVDTDFYTVAFNNDKCIYYQIKLLRKNIKNKFTYTVVDNSTKEDISAKIKKVCEENNVNYYRVRVKLPFTDPSVNHGLVLNWIYSNLIVKRENNFAILDHDVFLMKELDTNKYLKNHKIAGFMISYENNSWLIWPGFYWANYDFIKDFEVNFLPCKRMDTGGMNYHNIYKHIPHDDINFLVERRDRIIYNDEEANLQKDSIQYIDDIWLHTICGGAWADVGNKYETIYNMLDKNLGIKVER